MPTFKCTMLFQLQTGASSGTIGSRIGGWSESWYNSEPLDTIKPLFATLCQRRAAMLPTGAAIIGQRYQQVVPHVTSSQVGSNYYPGTSATAPDVPQMAILVKIGALAGVPNIRQWAMRGLPDARVINGEYFPTVAFTTAFDAFCLGLISFQFRGVNLQADQGAINFIDAGGDVWLNSPLTVTAGQLIQVIKATNASDRLVGGRYQVESVSNSTNFQLRNYDLGLVQGGTARIYEMIYPSVNATDCTLGRVTVRKVGRPFFSYRGRRSNRR